MARRRSSSHFHTAVSNFRLTARRGLVSADLARHDADWYVDRLHVFAHDFGATTVHTALSRTVIDVNRDPSGASLYPGQATTGLVPTETFDGRPLYRDGAVPTPKEIERRKELYFAPYHAALAQELARLRGLHKRVVLYDSHSIRSVIPRLFPGKLPVFNIGIHGMCVENFAYGPLHQFREAFVPGSWPMFARMAGQEPHRIRYYLERRDPEFEEKMAHVLCISGLKLRGAGEWLFEKHGTTKRRAWRKLHIGIDAGNGEIVAFDLTDKDVDDASHVPTLLDQLTQDPASFMADGAYDRVATYDAILARNPSARFIVPPCKGAVPGPTPIILPTQRDLHVFTIDEHGRMNWQKTSGYNKRSKVEAAMSRYKRVIGDTLKSRHDDSRTTEVAIAIKSLNRMNELGRAKFVRGA